MKLLGKRLGNAFFEQKLWEFCPKSQGFLLVFVGDIFLFVGDMR